MSGRLLPPRTSRHLGAFDVEHRVTAPQQLDDLLSDAAKQADGLLPISS